MSLDHQEAQRVVSTEPIESHQIRLHFSQVVTTAIVVSNTDEEKASQEWIKMFLENEYSVRPSSSYQIKGLFDSSSKLAPVDSFKRKKKVLQTVFLN